MALPNDIYGRTVILTTDGTIDTYTVTDSSANMLIFTFPIGTSQVQAYDSINAMAPGINPILTAAITQNINNFQTALNTFVTSRYTSDQRMNFIGIYINAQQNNLSNRMTYVGQLFPWQNSIITYSASYIAGIQAMTNPSQVAQSTWNFASLASSDPCITPIAALQIGN